MTSATASSGGPAETAAASVSSPPGRRRRLLAVLFDFVTAALAVLAASLAATLWLLLRTAWGRDDPAAGDAIAATALILATPPAWATWQVLRIHRGAGTAGQARLALAVVAGPRSPRTTGRAALLRLAYHPLALVAWLWLSALALMLGSTLLAAAFLGAAAVYALSGLLSAALVLRDPGARALHDRLAGTRLVRR